MMAETVDWTVHQNLEILIKSENPNNAYLSIAGSQTFHIIKQYNGMSLKARHELMRL